MGLNIGKLLKGALGVVAPTLGTALGGPLGGMAGSWLANELGVSENELPDLLKKESPELMAKLKELDQKFILDMERLEIDVFALEVQDKNSARELAKDNMKPHVMLTLLFVSGYFVIMGMMLSGHIAIQEGLKDMILLLVGMLTREIPTIMQFWFGSSHGSKKKTDALDHAIVTKR